MTRCDCPLCDAIPRDQWLKAKADEARLLLAPLLDAAGLHDDAQAQRDFALAILPPAGSA